jgi:hypothetical protein
MSKMLDESRTVEGPDHGLLRRVARLKATESAALAAIVPLLIWDLTLEKPARVGRFVVDYGLLRQDGRWLPVPLLTLGVVALFYVVDARGHALRALADGSHASAVRADIKFRYLWSSGVALAAMAITSISWFSVWESFYTPLGLTTTGCALAWLRSWCDSRYSFLVPGGPKGLWDK